MSISGESKGDITPEIWRAFWLDVLDGIKRSERDFPLGMGPPNKEIPEEALRRADEEFEKHRDEIEKAVELVKELSRKRNPE